MTTPDALRDAEHIADVSNIPYESDDDVGRALTSAPSAAQPEERHRKQIYTRGRIVLLDKLLRDLDIIIYSQLSAIYYLECSIFNFAIRGIVQLLFLTPKAATFPELTNPRSFIAAILISNLTCILLHCVSSNPTGSEATRGYLHGGLFIDFVGQLGPTSMLRLLAFDLVVFTLQVVMLGVTLEREKARASTPQPESTDTTTSGQEEEGERQDHDAEERGVLRSADHAGTNTSTEEGIELQNLRPRETEAGEDAGEGSGLLADSGDGPVGARGEHPRDALVSGDAVVAEVNMLRVLRGQWVHNPAPASPSRPSPSAILRNRFILNLVSND
ncbi:hypothetical protein AJ80_02132 [Polytolypa hystricis UAMH7299]|uniref:DUF1746 domain-containing protein n=1 Tax=Polytolypa hystricis (strain UAMH7299) TaxID=1447883 RepID=A0A2B7YSB6_POLH7|nr:hypothetical protein AJ80_02132 [Polytolypa hystricis UAMH7299]